MPNLSTMKYASKDYSNSLEHLSSLPFIVSPQRAGAFSREFNKNLVPQGGAFTRALKFEKLKAPLFPGPKGAVDSPDWCITVKPCLFLLVFVLHLHVFFKYTTSARTLDILLMLL